MFFAYASDWGKWCGTEKTEANLHEHQFAWTRSPARKNLVMLALRSIWVAMSQVTLCRVLRAFLEDLVHVGGLLVICPPGTLTARHTRARLLCLTLVCDWSLALEFLDCVLFALSSA